MVAAVRHQPLQADLHAGQIVLGLLEHLQLPGQRQRHTIGVPVTSDRLSPVVAAYTKV